MYICVDISEFELLAFSRKIFPDSILLYLNSEITDQDRIPVGQRWCQCVTADGIRHILNQKRQLLFPMYQYVLIRTIN